MMQKLTDCNFRFFFTHRNSNLNYLNKFMQEMEQRTLSDIICDNTVIEKVQEHALLIPHPNTNPIRVCQRLRENGNQPQHVTSAPISDQQQTISGSSSNVETTQSPSNQRVPKSLGLSPSVPFNFDPQFNFESLRPRHSGAFVANQHQSIFEAFRKLQNQDFRRITNSTLIKPIKFIERFDHSDAIILHHP